MKFFLMPVNKNKGHPDYPVNKHCDKLKPVQVPVSYKNFINLKL